MRPVFGIGPMVLRPQAGWADRRESRADRARPDGVSRRTAGEHGRRRAGPGVGARQPRLGGLRLVRAAPRDRLGGADHLCELHRSNGCHGLRTQHDPPYKQKRPTRRSPAAGSPGAARDRSSPPGELLRRCRRTPMGPPGIRRRTRVCRRSLPRTRVP